MPLAASWDKNDASAIKQRSRQRGQAGDITASGVPMPRVNINPPLQKELAYV